MNSFLEKHWDLSKFLSISLIIFLLLIGSNFSFFVYYFLTFVIGTSLLFFFNRLKKRNRNISSVFIIDSLCLTIYGLLDSIVYLLNILIKSQSPKWRMISFSMEFYDSLVCFITILLFGLILITKQKDIYIAWPQIKTTVQEKRSFTYHKVIGFILVILSLVSLIIFIYFHFVFTPYLQNYPSNVQHAIH